MPLNISVERVSQDDWCYAALRGVFTEEFYQKLTGGLDQLQWSEAIQSFYRQREVNLHGVSYYDALFNEQIRRKIAYSVGLFFGVEIAFDFDIAAHMMIKGDYIGPHTDANDHGETHRMAVMLNNDWEAAEGGVLLTLNGGSLSSIRDAWLPTANNGFLFEISEQSYHAVSPIVGQRPRYSLILTFKCSTNTRPKDPDWLPFVLNSDLENAISTAGYMGISAESFIAPYQYEKFTSTIELRKYVRGELYNSPTQWSYKHGTSMNVDQYGHQSKGTDNERTTRIERLRRLPPILIVRRKSGKYCLVDGSHRLCFANDNNLNIGVALFDEC